MNILFVSGGTWAIADRKVLRDYENRIFVYYSPHRYCHKAELRIIAKRNFCDREKGERYALHHCNVKKIVKALIARRAILKLSMREIMEVKEVLIEAKQKDDYHTILLS